MNFTADQMKELILFLIALVLSIGVHEFGHAWVATKLGDPLPRSQGRLTLNPVKHTDPIGTLLFPTLMHLFHLPLLGWGRPVETNPMNYTRRIRRATGSMLVAIAGPLMNLAMALLVSLLIVVGMRTGIMGADLANKLFTLLVVLNLFLMFFNLLPIPPLDGGEVLAWVLPRNLQFVVDFLSRWGFLLLLGMAMLPGVMSVLMTPVTILASYWRDALIGAAGL